MSNQPADVKLTIFEANLLNRIGSVTMALHALTVQMEAGRMQAALEPGNAEAPQSASGVADIAATASYAQDVATAALQMAGIKIQPRAEVQEPKP